MPIIGRFIVFYLSNKKEYLTEVSQSEFAHGFALHVSQQHGGEKAKINGLKIHQRKIE
jgi:hypothetical protein